MTSCVLNYLVDFVVGKETSELLVDELDSIISYHGVWYPKEGEDVPSDKLLS